MKHEFVILITDVCRAEDAVWGAEKVEDAFRAPFDVRGHKIQISASIGLFLFPDHGHEIDDLMKITDEALYQTKNSGRDGGLKMEARF
jgi:diguanylate cyclase (GGDEF)-like protein